MQRLKCGWPHGGARRLRRAAAPSTRARSSSTGRILLARAAARRPGRAASASNAAAPSPSGVDGDRGQRRREHAREVEVVEADHRDVARGSRSPRVARGQVDAAGQHVVVGEDRGDAGRSSSGAGAPRRRASNVNGALDASAPARARRRAARARSRRSANVGASSSRPGGRSARWPSSSRWSMREIDAAPRRRGARPAARRGRISIAIACSPARRAERRPRTAAARRPGRRAAPRSDAASQARSLPTSTSTTV